MAKLEGKIALVTGGTTGIGAATAQLFAREGAKVVVTGQNPTTIAEAQASFGPGVEVVRSDSSDLGAIESLFNDIRIKHGRIDVLFVNAGIAQFAPLEHVDEAFFDRQFNINVKGAYFTLKHGMPLVPDGGSVILTGSIAGTKGFPATSVYAATKAALRSFARTLAAELAGRQIRVNTISPGPIETPIFGKMEMPAEARDQAGQSMRDTVPWKRFGQPGEVASVALFLASTDSSFVNGAELAVDGGVSFL